MEISSFIQSLSFSSIFGYIAKFAYSGFLVVSIVILAKLVWQVWTDRQIVLGEIVYVVDAKLDDKLAQGITAEIKDSRNHIRDMVIRLANDAGEIGNSSNSIDYKKFFTEKDLADLKLATESIPEIELKIQGSDVGSILSALRKWMSPRNTLKVNVFKRGATTSYSIGWPRKHSNLDVGYVREGNRAEFVDEKLIGYSIGCRILWLEIAERSRGLAQIRPEIFCRWANARRQYEIIDAMVSAGGENSQITKILSSATKLVEDISEKIGGFPPLQNLYTLLLVKSDAEEAKILHAQENLRRVTKHELPIPFSGALDEESGVVVAASSRLNNYSAGQIVEVVGGNFGGGRVTIAAVVKNTNNDVYLILPDYAFNNGAVDVYAVANDKSNKITNRIAVLDRNFSIPGIAIAKVSYEVSKPNSIGEIVLKAPKVPTVSLGVRLVTTKFGFSEVALVQDVHSEDIESNFNIVGAPIMIKIKPDITRPGDGGAPVLDADNNLIAMAHSSSKGHSYLIDLKSVFDEYNFSLVQ